MTSPITLEDSDQDVAPALHPAAILSTDAEALQAAQALAEAAQTEVIQRDRERRLPWELVERFTASGLGSIAVPRTFGGPQLSYVTIAEVFRIISAVDPALGQIPQNQFGLLGLLQAGANIEQQQRLFASVLAGWRIGNGGPERGSKHTLDIQARLVKRDGRWLFSGEKFYSTGALFAHWIASKALDEQGRPWLAFIQRGRAGLRIVNDWSGFGQRTTASGTVLLNEVEVDENNLIPLWPLADKPSIQGAFSQLIQAAIDLGIADGALRDTLDFVRHKARPWIDAKVERAGDDPYVIADVGRLQVELHAAEALLHRAGRVLDEVAASAIDADAAARASIAVAEAKALTTEISLQASEKLLELAGSRATLAEFGLDRYWRNARTHTLHDPVRWKYHAVGAWHLNQRHPARHSWI
ncbi:SfnB family sulfur acquisition oxidoreductase [Pseudomonas chengduensis]|jgi:SfnB family sulfur acquisition oxidoreductase|uniref:Sulfur acquisition oxidoreductase, SfnB family n=1 Tax=Ectopseudomonas chengduensis TaxID=489632 RepID=A0A1G6QVL4_9GAMM|nr:MULTISPECIES: SfnB family sulfur acquisition oxidoreductase [Pseudomonas]KQO41679.1 SfnB family sulfur acquisition oxidoreductase [Pseudomonas sp. Leaf83]MBP3062323.1 SfnB family sulfur acquisition oxidoreductase [Pseudomonas chengduensis]MDH0960486.1 SfnB family sulfur acquisition oxidoreductase [Pseudomonas chengduensis]MDH1536740.1 SfnB family sulfur acquisition oxidoreductase [Pseudomonas chengduensis]MDH1621616.1 SfnB family sulfur acquisition oxidoreductase [Pseudomonas chengduensis]